MKWIIGIMLIVFLVGCTNPDIVSQSIPIEPESSGGFLKTVPLEESPLESQGTVSAKFYVGTRGAILGRDVKVVSMSPEGRTVLEINNIQWNVYSTKTREVVEGLDFVIDEFHYSVTDPADRYVVIKASELNLGPDEYVFFWEKPRTIGGSSVELVGIRRSPRTVKFEVGSGGGNLITLFENQPQVFQGLEFTVLDSFPRELQYENYALVRVIPIQDN